MEASLSKPDNAYPICFHNGNFVSWEEAVIHANCLSMRYALSVFEGIRLYRQPDIDELKPFALEAHVDRLVRSLDLMLLPDPGSNQIDSIIKDLVIKNQIIEDTYIRVAVNTINFGELASPPTPSLTVTATKMGRKRWLAQGKKMKVSISKWQRTAELAFPSAAKNISNYAGPRLALQEAIAAGYDSTILINHEGYLCEAPTAALFIIQDEEVVTPPLSEGILPSITRKTILQLCELLGIRATERRLRPADAYLADEAFLCGTGIEIAPIASFDGHSLKKMAESPITNKICQAYFQLVRGEITRL
ncbi:aminotransferase class IV [Argonema antarcticum]|uniref:aminotransferase class IV n=1 Tax=Argonema antarcticum TaxID=2942763 RepID=UPI0020133999|nr:aminotransferase class IV [Argonema antarcticum]MCL1474121.1 aminotransferase class IV [Argonema antarcticum A004/B2]